MHSLQLALQNSTSEMILELIEEKLFIFVSRGNRPGHPYLSNVSPEAGDILHVFNKHLTCRHFARYQENNNRQNTHKSYSLMGDTDK